MADYLYVRFKNHLSIATRQIPPEKLEEYAEAIFNKGSPLETVWGFIDGTVRAICRPSVHQKVAYNGHKRVHALKYQSVTTPDGLIVDLFGPVEGRRHDMFLLKQSNLRERLRQYSHNSHGEIMSIYGDPAYSITGYILSGYKGARLDETQQLFNKKMSAVRATVEYGFQRITTLFAWVDFKKNQKIALQNIGVYYFVAAFLVNVHSCYNSNQTAAYFNIRVPSPRKYILNQDDD